ncbi:MAG: hypothetical protein HQ592_08635 [Planctomycetes bacterium]|nr:hypothetical protein [Planctomycetota bacterium]
MKVKKAPQAATDPNVVELSELQSGINVAALPELCQRALEREPCKAACRTAWSFVERLYTEQQGKFNEPFVFCCLCALKVLVVPVEGKVYLAFCRSPFKDSEHLAKAADWLDIPRHKVTRMWEENLHEFDLDFAKKVRETLGLQGIEVRQETWERTDLLAQAYGPYEFDVITYDLLHALDSGLSLQIKFAEKRGEAIIARVILHQTGDAARVPTPIVGLALPAEEWDVEEVLHSPLLQMVSGVMRDAILAPVVEGKEQKTAISPMREDKNWKCEITSHVPESTPDVRAHRLVDHVKAIVRMAAQDPSPSYLRKELETKDFSESKAMLLQNRRVLSKAELKGDNKETLWSFVTTDLTVAIDLLGQKGEQEDIKAAIDEVLLGLEERFALVPAPRLRTSILARREVLRQDLLAGGNKYISGVLRASIPDHLEGTGFEHDAVTACLSSDRDRTTEALVDALRSKALSFESKQGRAAARAVLQWYEKHATMPELEAVLERLYKAAAPETRRFLLMFFSNGIGVFYSASTLGFVPARPIIRKIKQKEYDAYIRKRLSSWSSRRID